MLLRNVALPLFNAFLHSFSIYTFLLVQVADCQSEFVQFTIDVIWKIRVFPVEGTSMHAYRPTLEFASW